MQQVRAVLLLPAGQQGPGLLCPVPGLPARALLLRPSFAPPLSGQPRRSMSTSCRSSSTLVRRRTPPRRRATPGPRSHTRCVLGAGEEDVQRKIAFISGDRIFWGAEAIIELCRWFDWPYPLARFGYLVPKPLRDVLYQIVADNRYRWCAAGPYRHRTLPSSSLLAGSGLGPRRWTRTLLGSCARTTTSRRRTGTRRAARALPRRERAGRPWATRQATPAKRTRCACTQPPCRRRC